MKKDNEEELLQLIRCIERDTRTLSIVAIVSVCLGILAAIIAALAQAGA